MVFLEANAAGKPVIGGRSGGTSEAILDKETGFLVDPSDDQELRNALYSLLNDSALRRSMGLAGLQRAQTEFSWESRATELRAISHAVATAKNN
jgi:phosphatidylinositol alpha-1,6-mannosyltransferase